MTIWLEEIGMRVLLWLLGLVDSIFEVFGSVAGLEKLVGEQTLAEYVLGLPAVAKVFWTVFLAAIVICGVCAVIAIVKNTVISRGAKRHARTVAQSVSALFVSLAMAAMLVFGVGAADALLREFNTAVNGNEATKISHNILDLSVNGGAVIYDESNILGLNKYDDDGNAVYISPLYSFAIDETPVSSIEELKPKYYPEDSRAVVFLDNNNDPYDFKRIYEIDPNTNELRIKDYGRLVPLTQNDGYYVNYATGEYYTKDDLRDDIWTETVTHVFGRYKSVAGFPVEWIAPSASAAGNNWQKFTGFMAAATKTGITSIKDMFTSEYWSDAVSDTPGIINPENFNFLIAYLTTIIIAIALIGATLGLVKRVFDIVILFITLPGIAATIPLDDGAKFKLWRETVISKLFLAFGSVLAVNVFFIVAPSLWNASIYAASSFTNTVLKMALICGGALTISGGQLLLARLLGTSAEESREMGQSARTLMGGAMTGMGLAKAAGRGLFGYRNANGQRVGGLIKGGASLAGSVAGGALNAVGGAIGGQAYRQSKFGRGVSKTQQALRSFGGSSGWFGSGTLGGAVGNMLGNGASKITGSKGLYGLGENFARAVRPSEQDKLAEAQSRYVQAANRKRLKEVHAVEKTARTIQKAQSGIKPLWKK